MARGMSAPPFPVSRDALHPSGLRIDEKPWMDALREYKKSIITNIPITDFSNTQLHIERLGAEWGDPVSPDLTDTQFMTATRKVLGEIKLKYVLM